MMVNGKLIDYLKFFDLVLRGEIKLTNDKLANVWASWKVDGQDFYVYGRYSSVGEKTVSVKYVFSGNVTDVCLDEIRKCIRMGNP